MWNFQGTKILNGRRSLIRPQHHDIIISQIICTKLYAKERHHYRPLPYEICSMLFLYFSTTSLSALKSASRLMSNSKSQISDISRSKLLPFSAGEPPIRLWLGWVVYPLFSIRRSFLRSILAIIFLIILRSRKWLISYLFWYLRNIFFAFSTP